jgi:tetratricopeptide (TPR) repeat protein
MTCSFASCFLHVRRLFIGLSFAAALAGATSALQEKQAATGVAVIEGTVFDVSGAIIPGVALRLEPDSSNSIRDQRQVIEASSNSQGRFTLAASASGRYRLRANKEGFRQLVKELDLVAGSEERIDVMLEVVASGDHIFAEPFPAPAPAVPTEDSSLQLSDEPNFTVAGVTDYSNAGLHGSDANVRTSEALSKEAAELRSRPKGPLMSMAPRPADVHRGAGDAKESAGDPVGAVHEYETAVKLDPSEENYFAWGAELLLHRAGPAAVEVFHKGTSLYPKSSRMFAGLGVAYYADGQYTEAAAQMCKSSDLDPADRKPYLFLGKMEKASSEPLPCSEEHLKRFAGLWPTEALANYYYGLVLWKKARKAQDASGFASAENYLRRAVANDPSLGDAYLQLGALYNARGQRDAALAAFQQAVAAAPSLSAAHYQLSLAYRRAGASAKADEEMKRYVERHRFENAEVEKEHRELRQFVTVLRDRKPPP